MLFKTKKNLHFTLIRHGQSESNKNKTFTGWNDVNLTLKGKLESQYAGNLLKKAKITYSKGYTSFLIRAINTYELIIKELSLESGRKFYKNKKNI